MGFTKTGAVAGVAALLVGGFAGAAISSAATSTASCPTVTLSNGTLTIKCSVPVQTVTATVTAPAPTSSAPTTSSAAPSPTSTTTAPAPAAFPSAANTGVPAGTVLTAYTGPATITTAGTVIDGKTITSCLDIRANNVTIKNSLSRTNGCFFNILSDNGNTGLLIQDSEIDGANNTTGDSAINGGGYTCLRCNVHGTIDGFKAGYGVVIQDSYIHDLAITSTTHNDGIQSLGTTSLTIKHNTIVVAAGATSAVILSTGAATDMRNVLIDGNYFAGGAFTVYGGYQAGTDALSKVSNIAITNNQFSTQIYPKSGYYGPLTSTDSPVVVTGNTWADGPLVGQTVG